MKYEKENEGTKKFGVRGNLNLSLFVFVNVLATGPGRCWWS
jgi:hypothetical protein